MAVIALGDHGYDHDKYRRLVRDLDAKRAFAYLRLLRRLRIRLTSVL